MRLFSKILLFTLLVGLLPLAMMSILIFWGVEDQVRSDTTRSYNALTRVVAKEIARTIDEGYRYVQLIAANPVLKSPQATRKIQQSELESVFRYNHIFEDLSFLDTNGNVRASVLYSFRGFWNATSWFEEAIQGSVVVSAAHVSLYPFDVVLSVLIPVTDSKEEITGIVAGQMDMQKVQSIMEAVDIGNLSDIFLVDSDANVVLSTDDTPAFEQIPHEAVAAAIHNGEKADMDGYVVSIAAVASDDTDYLPDWHIVLIQPERIAHASMNQARRALLFAALLSVVVVITLSILMSNLIAKPIRRLVYATRFLGHVDYPITLPRRTADEIGDLTEAFNTASQQITQARQSLQTAYHDMESQVKERTADLIEANRILKQEIVIRENTEKQLSAEKLRAEEASKAKSAFLASMSHELRTPLNHIIGFTELTVDARIGPLNDQQAEYLTDVLNSGRHLLELINDILDLSKVEAGKLELSVEEVVLVEIIEASATAVRQAAADKRITINTSIDDPSQTLYGDKVKITQIMHNLLSNAVKFTGPNGSIFIKVEHQKDSVDITVKDTGIGINADDLERIFDSFEQADRQGSNSEGTGLGLALSRKLAELHGGTLIARSEGEGTGSRFVVTLPRAVAAVIQEQNVLD